MFRLQEGHQTQIGLDLLHIYMSIHMRLNNISLVFITITNLE